MPVDLHGAGDCPHEIIESALRFLSSSLHASFNVLVPNQLRTPQVLATPGSATRRPTLCKVTPLMPKPCLQQQRVTLQRLGVFRIMDTSIQLDECIYYTLEYYRAVLIIPYIKATYTAHHRQLA